MFTALKGLKKGFEEEKPPVDILDKANQFRDSVKNLSFGFDGNYQFHGLEVSGLVISTEGIFSQAKQLWRIKYNVLILRPFKPEDIVDPKMVEIIDPQTAIFNAKWFACIKNDEALRAEFFKQVPTPSSKREYMDPEDIGRVVMKVGSIVGISYTIPMGTGAGPLKTSTGMEVKPGQHITFDVHFEVRRKSNSIGYFTGKAAAFAPTEQEKIESLKWIMPAMLPFPKIPQNVQTAPGVEKMKERIQFHERVKGSPKPYEDFIRAVNTLVLEQSLPLETISKFREPVVFGPNEPVLKDFLLKNFGIATNRVSWNITYDKTKDARAYNKLIGTLHAVKYSQNGEESISYKIDFANSRELLTNSFGVTGSGGAYVLPTIVKAAHDCMYIYGVVNIAKTYEGEKMVNSDGEEATKETIVVDAVAVHVDMIQVIKKIGIPISTDGARALLAWEKIGLFKTKEQNHGSYTPRKDWFNLTESKKTPEDQYQYYVIGKNIPEEDVARFYANCKSRFNGSLERACKYTANRLMGDEDNPDEWQGTISALSIPDQAEKLIYEVPQIYAVQKTVLEKHVPEVSKTTEQRMELLEKLIESTEKHLQEAQEAFRIAKISVAVTQKEESEKGKEESEKGKDESEKEKEDEVDEGDDDTAKFEPEVVEKSKKRNASKSGKGPKRKKSSKKDESE